MGLLMNEIKAEWLKYWILIFSHSSPWGGSGGRKLWAIMKKKKKDIGQVKYDND